MTHHHHHHCECDPHHDHSHEHHHEHSHEHHGSMRHSIVLIVVSALLLIAAVIVEHTCRPMVWQLLILYLIPYIIIGHDTLLEAVRGLVHGDAFNEHLLMSIATIGAMAIGFMPGAEPQFAEAVVVMLFFAVGELFEAFAEGKSRDSIAHLMNIRPDEATVERDGSVVTVEPTQVVVGETIVIRPGELVPLDGVVIEGESALNTVALTGESVPRSVAQGDEVISGCVNMTGVLRVRTTTAAGESTASKIISLVENAGERKSRREAFITRFARVYTPTVVVAAVLLAVLPPLFAGSFAQSFPTWLYRALMFLIVSCPCALVISVPLTFFGGLGGASRRGILIKGANYLDSLATLSTVVLDKTGTLTRGRFAVTAVHPDDCDEHRLLHLAAHVEHYSTHPIGAALRDAFPAEATDGCAVTDVEEIAGQGVRARVASDIVHVGNVKLMEAIGAKWHPCEHRGTIIHVAINGTYAGHIVINDELKPDIARAINSLRSCGVEHVVMLTGDNEAVAAHVAAQLGISDYHAALLPADKVEWVERLMTVEHRKGTLAFVGDGINDAPVLARADVGIAMGALGSDAAIEAADVVLMDDNPTKISLAVTIARRTVAIARQNVVLAIAVKLAVLVLAAMGVATMWMAVFADVGVTVLAVLNAMRALTMR